MSISGRRRATFGPNLANSFGFRPRKLYRIREKHYSQGERHRLLCLLSLRITAPKLPRATTASAEWVMLMRHLFSLLGLALALTTSAVCQQQTMARLSHEVSVDTPRTDAGISAPHGGSAKLHDSATSRGAAEALFVRSDLKRARVLAERALRHDAQDAEALFVRMELSAITADELTELDSAVRLAEAGAYAPGDLRVRLAAVRVRELAANTPQFRRAVPQLQALLASSPEASPDLHVALLNAAMDGAPGLDPYAVARAAGILTDWRVVGPFGSRPLVDFDRQLLSPATDLAENSYQNRVVENFEFPDGRLRLPDYLSRRGVFYAAAHFASLTSQSWNISAETAGMLELYVDGHRVLRTSAGRQRTSTGVQLAPGPHRVLLKFAGSAAPVRIAVVREPEALRAPLRARLSLAEATYLLAAEHYANAEPAAATRQIDAVDVSPSSVPLLFLRAQSLSAQASGSADAVAAWTTLNARSAPALAADEALAQHAFAIGEFAAAGKYASDVLSVRGDNRVALEVLTQAAPAGNDASELWARRLSTNPSCDALRGAVPFYATHDPGEKNASLKKLDGCAPESLDYAQALARAGDHAAAVRALNALLAAAPLNRPARLMLVRELQLSGDDAGAQHAAADWLRIAPNAENYHRLAASASTGESSRVDFYAPYRRDTSQLARDYANETSAVVLLDDHVAIARPDGGVSLYVHTARRLASQLAAQSVIATVPRGAQKLTLRVLHRDGSATAIDAASLALANAGDIIDAEWVVHFAGDGGIPEHAEAFQYTFGKFDEPVLSARFVALTPADRAEGGVVIATGEPPRGTTQVRDGMLERSWRKDVTPGTAASAVTGLAIIRVVEQENGWSVPRDAERRRRIETIHPGPRPQDS